MYGSENLLPQVPKQPPQKLPARLAPDLADDGADCFHGLPALFLGSSSGAFGFFLGRFLGTLSLSFGSLGSTLFFLGRSFRGPIGLGGLLLLEFGALLFQLGALGSQRVGLGSGALLGGTLWPLGNPPIIPKSVC